MTSSHKVSGLALQKLKKGLLRKPSSPTLLPVGEGRKTSMQILEKSFQVLWLHSR
jgi:hypothetical protein